MGKVTNVRYSVREFQVGKGGPGDQKCTHSIWTELWTIRNATHSKSDYIRVKYQINHGEQQHRHENILEDTKKRHQTKPEDVGRADTLSHSTHFQSATL